MFLNLLLTPLVGTLYANKTVVDIARRGVIVY